LTVSSQFRTDKYSSILVDFGHEFKHSNIKFRFDNRREYLDFCSSILKSLYVYFFACRRFFSAPSEAGRAAIANLAFLFLQEAGKNKKAKFLTSKGSGDLKVTVVYKHELRAS
jgi:hypothetical protein